MEEILRILWQRVPFGIQMPVQASVQSQKLFEFCDDTEKITEYRYQTKPSVKEECPFRSCHEF